MEQEEDYNFIKHFTSNNNIVPLEVWRRISRDDRAEEFESIAEACVAYCLNLDEHDYIKPTFLIRG